MVLLLNALLFTPPLYVFSDMGHSFPDLGIIVNVCIIPICV